MNKKLNWVLHLINKLFQNYYVKYIKLSRLHLIQNQIKSHKVQSLEMSFYLWIHPHCIYVL